MKEPKLFEEKYPPGLILGGNMENHDIVGYCHNPVHKGYLKRSQLKDHECLGRQCEFLEKNELSRYFMDQYFKKRKKIALKNIERLWRTNLISATIYMELQDAVRGANNSDELEAILDKRIEIPVVIRDLFRFGQIYEEEHT